MIRTTKQIRDLTTVEETKPSGTNSKFVDHVNSTQEKIRKKK